MFASVPEEDQATYPDGWDQAELSELHDAVQQMIAEMSADQRASATGDPTVRETPLRTSSEVQDPASRTSAGDSISPTTPHPQTLSPALTQPPTTPSQGGVALQPSPDWGTTPQAPTQSTRWEGWSTANTSRYLDLSVKNQMLTSRDVQGKPVSVMIDYIKGRIAMDKALRDPFFAVDQTIKPLLHSQVLSFYNMWARIKDPSAPKVTAIELITLDKWAEQFDFRAQMEAEAVGGNLANQLATLLLRTIYELTK